MCTTLYHIQVDIYNLFNADNLKNIFIFIFYFSKEEKLLFYQDVVWTLHSIHSYTHSLTHFVGSVSDFERIFAFPTRFLRF